jgi:hypothetical protein
VILIIFRTRFLTHHSHTATFLIRLRRLRLSALARPLPSVPSSLPVEFLATLEKSAHCKS